jgi:hypothetical protein
MTNEVELARLIGQQDVVNYILQLTKQDVKEEELNVK